MIDQIFKYAVLLNALVAAVMAFLTLYGGFWVSGATFVALTVLSIYNYRALTLLEKELDNE
jgi:membrane protein implicated in regulation of membrane protease activity